MEVKKGLAKLYWVDPYQLQEGKSYTRVFYLFEEEGHIPIIGLLYVAREKLPALEGELKAQGYKRVERLKELYGPTLGLMV